MAPTRVTQMMEWRVLSSYVAEPQRTFGHNKMFPTSTFDDHIRTNPLAELARFEFICFPIKGKSRVPPPPSGGGGAGGTRGEASTAPLR